MSESDKYIIAGVMSGTSLDGLDVAICEFAKSQSGYHYKILDATTVAYDRPQKNKLQAAPYLNVENYFLLHHQFGKFIGKQVAKLSERSGLKPGAVASHGHTIFHQPTKGFTTQMGCG
ncbi:MAG: anhydro-N-acetylmuramic acid kinase, partial [Bacteroidia bacterium]|nr:anhydro-N-acetylmuramic acid kinase [Bacteroidia bacterium]